jgi:hypothetical protein
VVDAAGFSDCSSVQQTLLNARIVQVLEAAFTRAGMAAVWEARRFPSHTGDGYIIGMPPEDLPSVLHPLLRDLQSELWLLDQRRLAKEPRLRLRASVHVGPLPNSGVGAAMTETHRLLDSEQVRDALKLSHEEVTYLAVIVSERVYQDAVRAEYTDLHPAQFRAVEATTKRSVERAYLYVPQPSSAAAPAPPSPPPVNGRGVHIHGDKIRGDKVHGDKHVTIVRADDTPVSDFRAKLPGALRDLSADNVMARIKAAKWLAALRCRSAIPQLALQLELEHDPEASYWLIQALGSTGSEEAKRALETYVKRTGGGASPLIRSAIDEALRAIGEALATD